MLLKRVSLLGALLVVGSASPASAQDVNRPHDFSSRGHALCFDFSSFAIGAFNGGIGGKLRTSETWAWTLSTDVRYVDSESDDDTPAEERTDWDLGLTAGFEKHRPVSHRISPYVGADAQISHRWSERKLATGQEWQYRSTTWGIDLLVGVECWIMQDVSLAAQYDLGFRSGKTKNDTEGSDESEQTHLSAGISGTSLTLSYYF